MKHVMDGKSASVRPAEEQDRKEALLAVLARAAEDDGFLAELAEDPVEACRSYYTLTHEELAALMSGDIVRIESWVGKLPKHLTKWLWCGLSQEKW